MKLTSITRIKIVKQLNLINMFSFITNNKFANWCYDNESETILINWLLVTILFAFSTTCNKIIAIMIAGIFILWNIWLKIIKTLISNHRLRK